MPVKAAIGRWDGYQMNSLITWDNNGSDPPPSYNAPLLSSKKVQEYLCKKYTKPTRYLFYYVLCWPLCVTQCRRRPSLDVGYLSNVFHRTSCLKKKEISFVQIRLKIEPQIVGIISSGDLTDNMTYKSIVRPHTKIIFSSSENCKISKSC